MKVVLICIFLMTKVAEHLSVGLWVMSVSSFVKCLLKYFAHFCWVVSLFVDDLEKFFIVCTQSVPCFFIFLIVPFDEVQFIKCYLMFSAFGVLSKKSLHNLRW